MRQATQCFVHRNSAGRGEIETPLAGHLGDANGPGFVCVEHRRINAARFAAHDQDIAVLKICSPQRRFAGRVEQPEPPGMDGGEERGGFVMDGESQARPVIHCGSFELTIVQNKTHRPHDVKRRARCDTQPTDVAHVRRDLRLKQGQFEPMSGEMRGRVGVCHRRCWLLGDRFCEMVDLNESIFFDAECAEPPAGTQRHAGVDEADLRAAQRDVSSSAGLVVMEHRGVPEEPAPLPRFFPANLRIGEACPHQMLPQRNELLEPRGDARVVGLIVRAPVRVGDEAVVELDDGFERAKELAVGRGHDFEERVDLLLARSTFDGGEPGRIDPVAGERLVEPLFDEPTKRGHRLDRVFGQRVTIAVKNEIKNVVMIPADESRVFELDEQIDHAARVGPAVDVIAGEDQLRGPIGLADQFEQRLERAQHAVNVAYNPTHDREYSGTPSPRSSCNTI